MFALLKSWFRRWLLEPPRINGGKPASIKEGAAQLVERARLGDQNAMALMKQVGENAKKKQPRAMKAYAELMTYIKANPVTKTMAFGEEMTDESELDSIAHGIQGMFAGENDYTEVVVSKVPDLALRNINKAVVCLANGPSLLPNDDNFKSVRESLSPEDEKAFMLGYKHGIKELDAVPEKLHCPFLLGHVMGTARRIQAVRLPKVPVSVLSPQVGMELGE
jgi:hypothetical protein